MIQQLPVSPRRSAALLVALLCALGACSPSNAGEAPKSPGNGSGSSSSQSPQTYVALGDSFTSAPLVPVTDVANGCFRSSANYPSLVARSLGAELDDRSCGAAQIIDLTTGQYPDVPAQLSAVRPDTTLVTIGIGGNDEGVFVQLTRECPRLRATDPQGAPCRAKMTAGGHDVLLASLENTAKRLTSALDKVHTSAPQARVLVVGYPQIVAAGKACRQLPLAKGDFAYAASINVALNDALRRAARASDSTYVDVWAASAGHDICSRDPWINGSVNDQKRAAAYHPFAEEQAAVADLVVAAARR
jgi:lysophospholipase L1-like esterase